MPRKANKCRFSSLDEMKAVSIEEVSMLDMTLFVKERVFDINNYDWVKQQALDQLFDIFARHSSYWKIVIDGDFYISFVKNIGKKRWPVLRDKVLLVVDRERYEKFGFIDGLAEWKLPSAKP